MNAFSPYQGVLIAGYVISGLFVLVFLAFIVYLKAVKGKPKFIKYDNNGGND